MICSWAVFLSKWAFFPQYVKQLILWRALRSWTTENMPGKLTLHWTSLLGSVFATPMPCACTAQVALVWFYCTLMSLNVWVKIEKYDTHFSPRSSKSIFGHTNKKRSIKTTELHFFLRESYLINQRLGGERINVSSRWGGSHLRKQWMRRRGLKKSATHSETKQATCHFSAIECSRKKASQESYSTSPHHWVSGVSSLAP